ncbi:MAG TPA: ankyrin repeat domain-containing protein, partial [Bacteroidetes bacterium]|nr:ankyrin repeat domain-containing protein [Bacteroidota bacterium]
MEIEEILKRQDVKALKEAINHGVDISKVKSIDFIFEVKEIDFTFLKILIDNGININEKDEIGYLLFSCIFGENEEEKTIIRDEAFLKYFIEFIMKNNNIEKDFFEEILEEITLLGKIEIIQIMIDNGFDINYYFDGISLLAFACMFSDIKLVEFYLAYGADVKKTFIMGEVSVNILIWSVMASQIMKTNKMQKLIIDKQKQHKMIKENSPIILKLLIQEGANVNFTDSNNLSVLMYACLFSDIEMIEILIKNGADVNYNLRNMSLLGFILLLTEKGFEQIMFNENFGKLDEDKVFFH